MLFTLQLRAARTPADCTLHVVVDQSSKMYCLAPISPADIQLVYPIESAIRIWLTQLQSRSMPVSLADGPEATQPMRLRLVQPCIHCQLIALHALLHKRTQFLDVARQCMRVLTVSHQKYRHHSQSNADHLTVCGLSSNRNLTLQTTFSDVYSNPLPSIRLASAPALWRAQPYNYTVRTGCSTATQHQQYRTCQQIRSRSLDGGLASPEHMDTSSCPVPVHAWSSTRTISWRSEDPHAPETSWRSPWLVQPVKYVLHLQEPFKLSSTCTRN